MSHLANMEKIMGSAACPLKVLIFLETSSIRGAAKSMITFCDTAAEQEWKLDGIHFSPRFITFQRHGSPNELVAELRKRGIPVEVIVERHRWDLRVLRAVNRAVESFKPHLIHSNNVKSHFFIRALRIHRSRCWLAYHHGYTATDLKMRLYNQVDRWSLKGADQVIVPCAAFLELLVSRKVSRDRIAVLHNGGGSSGTPMGLEVERLRERMGINKDDYVLLSVGRFSAEKGHSDLVKALGILRVSQPSCNHRLILVGSGPELDNLENLVDNLCLRSYISIMCNEPEVQLFFHLANVFVLPSLSEGSPHVLLEAMAASLPIVATSVGGIPEILEDGETGVLVPASRPESLAAAIQSLRNSQQTSRTYGQKASKMLSERFSPEQYARGLLRYYMAAVELGGKAAE